MPDINIWLQFDYVEQLQDIVKIVLPKIDKLTR
jgi:hypothetical protein